MEFLKPIVSIDRLEPPRIISSGQDDDPVPFVPAFDLLEEVENNPTPEQVAAIAISIIGQEPQIESNWRTNARLEAISNRL